MLIPSTCCISSLQVLMDQLWCCIYTIAKPLLVGPQKDMKLMRASGGLTLRKILQTLHSSGVDWTFHSYLPEEFFVGRWERQIPIPFLLESCGPDREANTLIIWAICEGESACLVRCCNCCLSARLAITCMLVLPAQDVRRWLNGIAAFMSSMRL